MNNPQIAFIRDRVNDLNFGEYSYCELLLNSIVIKIQEEIWVNDHNGIVNIKNLVKQIQQKAVQRNTQDSYLVYFSFVFKVVQIYQEHLDVFYKPFIQLILKTFQHKSKEVKKQTGKLNELLKQKIQENFKSIKKPIKFSGVLIKLLIEEKQKPNQLLILDSLLSLQNLREYSLLKNFDLFEKFLRFLSHQTDSSILLISENIYNKLLELIGLMEFSEHQNLCEIIINLGDIQGHQDIQKDSRKIVIKILEQFSKWFDKKYVEKNVANNKVLIQKFESYRKDLITSLHNIYLQYLDRRQSKSFVQRFYSLIYQCIANSQNIHSNYNLYKAALIQIMAYLLWQKSVQYKVVRSLIHLIYSVQQKHIKKTQETQKMLTKLLSTLIIKLQCKSEQKWNFLVSKRLPWLIWILSFQNYEEQQQMATNMVLLHLQQNQNFINESHFLSMLNLLMDFIGAIRTVQILALNSISQFKEIQYEFLLANFNKMDNESQSIFQQEFSQQKSSKFLELIFGNFQLLILSFFVIQEFKLAEVIIKQQLNLQDIAQENQFQKVILFFIQFLNKMHKQNFVENIQDFVDLFNFLLTQINDQILLKNFKKKMINSFNVFQTDQQQKVQPIEINHFINQYQSYSQNLQQTFFQLFFVFIYNFNSMLKIQTKDPQNNKELQSIIKLSKSIYQQADQNSLTIKSQDQLLKFQQQFLKYEYTQNLMLGSLQSFFDEMGFKEPGEIISNINKLNQFFIQTLIREFQSQFESQQTPYENQENFLNQKTNKQKSQNQNLEKFKMTVNKQDSLEQIQRQQEENLARKIALQNQHNKQKEMQQKERNVLKIIELIKQGSSSYNVEQETDPEILLEINQKIFEEYLTSKETGKDQLRDMIDKIEKIKNQFSNAEVQQQQLMEIFNNLQQNETDLNKIIQLTNKAQNPKPFDQEYDLLMQQYNTRLKDQILSLLTDQLRLFNKQQIEKFVQKDCQTDEGQQDIQKLYKEISDLRKKATQDKNNANEIIEKLNKKLIEMQKQQSESNEAMNQLKLKNSELQQSIKTLNTNQSQEIGVKLKKTQQSLSQLQDQVQQFLNQIDQLFNSFQIEYKQKEDFSQVQENQELSEWIQILQQRIQKILQDYQGNSFLIIWLQEKDSIKQQVLNMLTNKDIKQVIDELYQINYQQVKQEILAQQQQQQKTQNQSKQKNKKQFYKAYSFSFKSEENKVNSQDERPIRKSNKNIRAKKVQIENIKKQYSLFDFMIKKNLKTKPQYAEQQIEIIDHEQNNQQKNVKKIVKKTKRWLQIQDLKANIKQTHFQHYYEIQSSAKQNFVWYKNTLRKRKLQTIKAYSIFVQKTQNKGNTNTNKKPQDIQKELQIDLKPKSNQKPNINSNSNAIDKNKSQNQIKTTNKEKQKLQIKSFNIYNYLKKKSIQQIIKQKSKNFQKQEIKQSYSFKSFQICCIQNQKRNKSNIKDGQQIKQQQKQFNIQNKNQMTQKFTPQSQTTQVPNQKHFQMSSYYCLSQMHKKILRSFTPKSQNKPSNVLIQNLQETSNKNYLPLLKQKQHKGPILSASYQTDSIQIAIQKLFPGMDLKEDQTKYKEVFNHITQQSQSFQKNFLYQIKQLLGIKESPLQTKDSALQQSAIQPKQELQENLSFIKPFKNTMKFQAQQQHHYFMQEPIRYESQSHREVYFNPYIVRISNLIYSSRPQKLEDNSLNKQTLQKNQDQISQEIYSKIDQFSIDNERALQLNKEAQQLCEQFIQKHKHCQQPCSHIKQFITLLNEFIESQMEHQRTLLPVINFDQIFNK